VGCVGEEPEPGVGALCPAPESVARAIALRQLTAAPRTRAQLAGSLARKGVPDEVAEAVLNRFEEVHLVDDEDFARQWVRTRQVGRGLSRRALRQELRERGVAEETVRAAVDEVDAEAELEVARGLVRRRFTGMGSDDPVRRTRRLAGMLSRKGYSPSVVFRAIKDVTEEQSQGACDEMLFQEEDVE
jgi:regulatory protein